jgi:hypothetical protein
MADPTRQYDNNMRGALWINDKKNGPRHPDYKGSCEIDGVKYYMSAWESDGEGHSRRPVLSFRFERDERDDEHTRGRTGGVGAGRTGGIGSGPRPVVEDTPTTTPQEPLFDDDIPF